MRTEDRVGSAPVPCRTTIFVPYERSPLPGSGLQLVGGFRPHDC